MQGICSMHQNKIKSATTLDYLNNLEASARLLCNVCLSIQAQPTSDRLTYFIGKNVEPERKK